MSWFTNSFNGGQNEVIYPMLLKENTAQKLINANVTNGKIAPATIPVSENFTLAESGYYSNRDRSAVSWYNRHYWSYDNASSAPFYGGDHEDYLGIPIPSKSNGETALPVCTVISQGDFGDNNVTLHYCWCLVNSNGYESAPAKFDEAVYFSDVDLLVNEKTPVFNIQVSLPDDFEWPEGDGWKLKIYRTIDHGMDFFYLGTIDKPTNGTAENYNDTLLDSQLMFRNPLQTLDDVPPPDGGKYLCESSSVFFLAVGPTVYFSKLGNPHAWPITNNIGFDSNVTALCPVDTGVLVFTDGNAWLLSGVETPETIVKNKLVGNYGCLTNKSIATIGNAPIWLSANGICVFNGQAVSLISYKVMDIRKSVVHCAIASSTKYYLFMSDRCIVYDLQEGGIFYETDYKADFAFFMPYGNSIYFVRNDVVYNIQGDNPMEWTYISPYIGKPEMTTNKFRELITMCSEEMHLDFYLEDKLLFSVDIPKGRQTVKLPLNTVGQYVWFKLKSRGELRELAVVF